MVWKKPERTCTEFIPISGKLEVVAGSDEDDSLVIHATNTKSGSWELVQDVDGSAGGPFHSSGTFSALELFLFDSQGGNDNLVVNNPTNGIFSPDLGVHFRGGDGSDTYTISGGVSTDIIFRPTVRTSADGRFDYPGTQQVGAAHFSVENVHDQVQRNQVEVAAQRSHKCRP